MSLEVDHEEYTIPSDGNVTEEFKDSLEEYLHEISGVKIKNLRITQEMKDE
tara:strand:- start:563 stop:715 length:153 start_codon:yes stop_codon:yes gene_type:complete